MVEAPATKLDPILRLAIELNATDIHVQVGLPPMFRVRGKLVAHQSEPLSAEQCSTPSSPSSSSRAGTTRAWPSPWKC
jgi:Tfp pilus assembly pilus retraction ATPase PilT